MPEVEFGGLIEAGEQGIALGLSQRGGAKWQGESENGDGLHRGQTPDSVPE
jgi:hypothetical protein